MNERPFGARLTADGASFRLWAPAAKRVDLLLEKSQPMRCGDAGWFSADIPGVKATIRIPDRRRDRRSGSGIRVSTRRRFGPERGDRSCQLSMARFGLART